MGQTARQAKSDKYALHGAFGLTSPDDASDTLWTATCQSGAGFHTRETCASQPPPHEAVTGNGVTGGPGHRERSGDIVFIESLWLGQVTSADPKNRFLPATRYVAGHTRYLTKKALGRSVSRHRQVEIRRSLSNSA